MVVSAAHGSQYSQSVNCSPVGGLMQQSSTVQASPSMVKAPGNSPDRLAVFGENPSPSVQQLSPPTVNPVMTSR